MTTGSSEPGGETTPPSTGSTSREALLEVLRLWKPAAGPDGFEGLVAQALAARTGYTFRLARSGAQFGRDAATPKAPFSIAMEAKRYSESVPLQELVGKATLAAFALAEGVDLWVLAATVEVSEPTQRQLEEILDREGISLLTLDWAEAGLPPLAVLLAAARDEVVTWATPLLNAAKLADLAAGLDDIAADPMFGTHLAELIGKLSPVLLGLDAFRAKSGEWCERNFASSKLAQRHFSQFLTPLKEPTLTAARPKVQRAIGAAVQTARSDAEGDSLVAVLGGEGSGKTWAVANWWLSSDPRSILMLSIGRIADRLSADEEPLNMLARLAAHQDSRRDETAIARWRRRLERWSKGDSTRERFVVFIDGLNETSGKPWSAILRALMPAVHELGGVVIVTCREGYWSRDVALRLPEYVTVLRVDVQDYDDVEFADVMGRNGVDPADLPQRLNQFMRNPRICALALTLMPQLSGIEDLSVDRLLLEYWRARLREREDLVAHNDEDFRDLLVRHAREYRERPGTNFNRDEWRARSGAAERQDGRELANDLSDIEEGRFFDSSSGKYQFREETLHFALGLLVADELRDAIRAGSSDLNETLAGIIDPIRGFDTVADILTAAIAIATLDAGYSGPGIAALATECMSLQNLSDDALRGLIPHIALRPEPFLDAYETRDPRRDDGRFLRFLLYASERDPVARALDARVPRWLGSWSRASQDWGDADELRQRQERRNARIDAGLAQLHDDERAYFEAGCAELPNAAGLARAAALHLVGKSQSTFASAIVAFAFAHAIARDHPTPIDDVAWAIRLNRIDHEELGAEIRKEIAPFTTLDVSPPARAAAACALRLLGSLDDQIEAEQLSPPHLSAFSYPDISTVDPLDPDAKPPQSIEELTTRLHQIDPTAVWNHMSTTPEDHQLDRELRLLTRFDPDGLLTFLDRAANTVAVRSGLPLRQLGWRLPWLSPILSEDTIAGIVRRIEQIGNDPSLIPAEDQKFVTGMMVEAVFPHLDAGAQLDLLQSLPIDAPYYLRYADLAKPLSAAEAERRLAAALSANPRILERTLLFLGASSREMTEGLRNHVISCLARDESSVRAAAAEVARRNSDAALDEAILAMPPPEDDDQSWGAPLVRSAFSKAVARRGRDDLVKQIPVEHLDWVAARMPAARNRLVETIEGMIDRLANPISSNEPSDAVVVLEVGEDSIETRIDLVDRGERVDDPVAAFNAEFGDDSGARFARRQELLHSQLDRFLAGLTSEGALMVARRPQMIGLAQIARGHPERYASWLRRILAVEDRHTLRRLQNLGLALAQNYAAMDPALAARTFAHLWKINPHVTVHFGRAKHAILDLALFTAVSSGEIDALRHRAFEEARDDGRIEQLVLAAEAAGAGAWLDAFVEARASSRLPVDQALALSVASFRPENLQSDELLGRDWRHGFLGAAAAAGRRRYKHAIYAKHWFSQVKEADDPRDRWRFLELGISAADRRQLLEPDSRLDAQLREIGGDVPRRLSKAAEKASADASKSFLGSKKATGLLAELIGP